MEVAANANWSGSDEGWLYVLNQVSIPQMGQIIQDAKMPISGQPLYFTLTTYADGRLPWINLWPNPSTSGTVFFSWSDECSTHHATQYFEAYDIRSQGIGRHGQDCVTAPKIDRSADFMADWLAFQASEREERTTTPLTVWEHAVSTPDFRTERRVDGNGVEHRRTFIVSPLLAGTSSVSTHETIYVDSADWVNERRQFSGTWPPKVALEFPR